MDLGDLRQGQAMPPGGGASYWSQGEGEGEWPSRGYLSVFWSPHIYQQTFRYPHEVPGLELTKSTDVLSHRAMAAMTR